MAGARPILSIISIILLAAGVLFDFFIVLSGAVNGGFEDKIYFLQADTTGIPGAPNPARWTYFSLCAVDGSDHSHACGPVHAAFPFYPQGDENFGTKTGLPKQFAKESLGKTTYYLSRVSWAFFLIALFFGVISLLLSLAALCARLGAYLAGLTTFFAFGSQAVAASLMTAWTVLGEKAFKSNGQDAKLGDYAYGFTWGAFVAFFLATVFFCAGGGASSSSSSSGGKKSYFGRKKSTKSNRGSFLDSEDGGRRGVKDEYD